MAHGDPPNIRPMKADEERRVGAAMSLGGAYDDLKLRADPSLKGREVFILAASHGLDGEAELSQYLTAFATTTDAEAAALLVNKYSGNSLRIVRLVIQ